MDGEIAARAASSANDVNDLSQAAEKGGVIVVHRGRLGRVDDPGFFRIHAELCGDHSSPSVYQLLSY
jgi:hypothetical protein